MKNGLVVKFDWQVYHCGVFVIFPIFKDAEMQINTQNNLCVVGDAYSHYFADETKQNFSLSCLNGLALRQTENNC